jgi:hypothetical protein
MCLVRKGHPIGNEQLTLERYLAYPHAMVTLAEGRQGIIDDILDERIAPPGAAQDPYFASAAWTIDIPTWC